MDMPETIYVWNGPMTKGWSTGRIDGSETKYIRADIAQKLKGYAVHQGRECELSRLNNGPCTCGLTEVLKEMEDE